MLKILLERWDKNSNKLKEIISKIPMEKIKYKRLVKLVFEHIYNYSETNDMKKISLASITQIDNGDYSGTFLYLLPFTVYDPAEYDYLMTYISYGSCSGCDTIEYIREYKKGLPNEEQINDFMSICRHIMANTIKPYNNGWKQGDDFVDVKLEQDDET